MSEEKAKKKATRSPSVPKPVYVMFKGDAVIVDVVRKPEDVLAVIDSDAEVQYQKMEVK